MSNKNNLLEVAKVFFKLGCFAFGGPAAHIAMFEEEVVTKRKWMDRQYFLDLMGLTNLIPGPNSTEMTMHCGHHRAGIPGLFVAGFCFIVPSVTLTILLAWVYTEYGSLPEAEPFINGIKPAVLSLIAGAILKLGKKALKGIELGILGAVLLAFTLVGFNEILVLLAGGVVGAIYFAVKNKYNSDNLSSFLIIPTTIGISKGLSTLSIFGSFLKIGAILYGSGYVLFAYLDAEFVAKGILTSDQLMDSVAAGQFTPGPVLSTASFIGFQLGGIKGAISATVGIFLPSFLFVLILIPFVKKIRQSKILKGFLDSVNIAAVAIMVGVLIQMGKDSLVSWQSVLIAVVSFVMTFYFKKINSAITIIVGALLGYFFTLI